MINQLKSGTITDRTIEVGDEDQMKFAEYMAITSGNTLLLDKAKIDQK